MHSCKTYNASVRTGLDRLIEEQFDRIRGKRIGLVANYASVTYDNRSAVDAVRALEPRSLVLFGPEHGYWGDVQYMEPPSDSSYRDVPVHSLYDGTNGHALLPEPTHIAGLDLLLIDLQDVGSRYYTYYATMLNCMAVAAATGTRVIVLDRPNPINGMDVEGPLLRPPFVSFVGQYPIPPRHGLTMGELATFLAETQRICKPPEVVSMRGWTRDMWWEDTGLPWVHPSPNMATPETAVVYPGMCLFEGTNVSEGRGTTHPFETFGAPWLEKFELADTLNELALPGVRFEPFSFTPSASKFAGVRCDGVRVIVTDRRTFRPVATGVHCVAAIKRLRPNRFEWNRAMYEWANCSAIDALTGGVSFRALLDTGGDLTGWIESWSADVAEFSTAANEYLRYEKLGQVVPMISPAA
jgi:uncharacterized protein YbbC (DUF1343 family)